MKILILGSSYSIGSFRTDENNYEHWHSHVCWYDLLAEEHDVTVYCGPNLGYMNYVDILMDIEELYNYDLCIIQECYEPKLQFHNEHTYLTHINGSLTKHQLSHRNIIFSGAVETVPKTVKRITGADISTPEMQHYFSLLWDNESAYRIAQSSVLHIDKLLKDSNVKSYVFCLGENNKHDNKDLFSEFYSHAKYMRTMTMATAGFDVFKEDPEYVNMRDDGTMAHFTELGNLTIAEMIREEVEEIFYVEPNQVD